MTGTNGEEVGPPAGGERKSVLDAVRQAALDLLGSLPHRPERLRVRAADVVLDVDWRATLTAAVPAADGAGAGTAAGHPPAEAEAGRPADGPDGERPAALHYICAPSVGTFYRAPEPGAAPFTTEGATVQTGQSVAIVEAMKLMLPVEADRSGRVVEVLVEDGGAVEYGERLLALVPVGTD